MEKAITASVSRGTFVFNGKKKKADALKYFCEETDKNGCINSQKTMSHVDEVVQKIQSELHSEVFEELLGYIKSAHDRCRNQSESSGFIQEIPAASLITGVNQADHMAMFSELVTLVRSRVTPLIAVLQAKDCSSVKTTISSFLSQLQPQVGGDEEEDTVSRGSDHGMDALISCYTRHINHLHKHMLAGSPRKRKSTGEAVARVSPPPVVLVLEDLEAFTPHVLHDLITMCSGRLADFPLVMVFGVATAVTALHRILPHHVSSLLCMEKFQVPPATECLSLIIDQLLLQPQKHTSPIGKGPKSAGNKSQSKASRTAAKALKFGEPVFRLGGQVFTQLIQTFLCHDFSLTNFISSFKFAVLDHFTDNAASQLCVSHPHSVLDNMNTCELDQIRSLRSFRRFVEGQPAEEQIKLLEDDAHCRTVMCDLLANLNSYHQTFFPVLRILHVLTSDLPKHPLGKHLRELYGVCLRGPLEDCMDYKDSLALLRTLCHDELHTKLTKCCHLLDNNDIPPCLHEVSAELHELLNKLDHITEGEMGEEEEDEKDEPRSLPRMDMTALRKTLQEKKAKKVTGYEVVRSSCVNAIHSLCRQYLSCPSSLPLHETCYYDNAPRIKQHLEGCPRGVIQRALSDPYHYLLHSDLKRSDGLIPATLPDLCIVYLLHLECGRKINLYDWMESFHTIMSAGTDKEDTKPDKLSQFIQAVSELQFLGFIKPTKKKTDHVARLTWGGC